MDKIHILLLVGTLIGIALIVAVLLTCRSCKSSSSYTNAQQMFAVPGVTAPMTENTSWMSPGARKVWILRALAQLSSCENVTASDMSYNQLLDQLCKIQKDDLDYGTQMELKKLCAARNSGVASAAFVNQSRAAYSTLYKQTI